ncbi:MAG: hypothetical protein AAGJ46_10715 [Planctomycetota bacterium]
MRYRLAPVLFASLFAAATAIAATPNASADDLATSAQPSSSGPIGLFDAEERGDVEIKFIARSDRKARIILTNKTDQPLQLDLPEAFAGVPVLAQFGGGGGGLGGGGGGFGGGGGGGQGVGGGLGGGGGGLGGGGGGFGGGGQFSIPPERTERIDVAVVCLDHGKKDPTSSKPYKMVPVDEYVDEPAVVELLKAFGRGETHHGATQAAVWAMNNGLTWNQLASKLTGTVRSNSRAPYFSRAELQAAVAYAREAARRAALAESEADHAEASPGESMSDAESGSIEEEGEDQDDESKEDEDDATKPATEEAEAIEA